MSGSITYNLKLDSLPLKLDGTDFLCTHPNVVSTFNDFNQARRSSDVGAGGKDGKEGVLRRRDTRCKRGGWKWKDSSVSGNQRHTFNGNASTK
eukprot:747174-Prorocentrum_minimum.AAC.5